MYICICNGVTDRDIRNAAASGCTTIRELKRELGVASECGKCASCAKDVLNDAIDSSFCNNRHSAALAAA